MGLSLLLVMLGSGCQSSPPLSPAVSDPAPAPIAAPADDIPGDAAPAVRAHLIKLREMRDLGQISNGDFQSRKAAFLSR